MTASANPGAPTTYTAQQLAAELHISVASIMRRIHDGSLPAFRIGRCETYFRTGLLTRQSPQKSVACVCVETLFLFLAIELSAPLKRPSGSVSDQRSLLGIILFAVELAFQRDMVVCVPASDLPILIFSGYVFEFQLWWVALQGPDRDVVFAVASITLIGRKEKSCIRREDRRIPAHQRLTASTAADKQLVAALVVSAFNQAEFDSRIVAQYTKHMTLRGVCAFVIACSAVANVGPRFLTFEIEDQPVAFAREKSFELALAFSVLKALAALAHYGFCWKLDFLPERSSYQERRANNDDYA